MLNKKIFNITGIGRVDLTQNNEFQCQFKFFFDMAETAFYWQIKFCWTWDKEKVLYLRIHINGLLHPLCKYFSYSLYQVTYKCYIINYKTITNAYKPADLNKYIDWHSIIVLFIVAWLYRAIKAQIWTRARNKRPRNKDSHSSIL